MKWFVAKALRPAKKYRSQPSFNLYIVIFIQTKPLPISISQILSSGQTILAEKIVTAGFDGFIDSLVRLIRQKEPNRSPLLFQQIAEFGNYIIEKKDSSFSLETEDGATRIGGNMPIMAHAIGQMGARVNCIGAFGYPQTLSLFETMSANCRLHTFANPGTCIAFEFNDGKIMLARMGELNSLGWDAIKQRVGLDTLISLYAEADLFCQVNWSEIDLSTDIWKGLLKDVLPRASEKGRRPISFFDLSDCSKRSPEAIREALELIKQFGQYGDVTLGLNLNEARLVYQHLFDRPTAPDEFEQLGKLIEDKMRPVNILLHSSREARYFGEKGSFYAKSHYTETPKISTGAGDNFNAGYCVAQLLGLDAQVSLQFANAVAGFYTQNGISPTLAEVSHLLAAPATP